MVYFSTLLGYTGRTTLLTYRMSEFCCWWSAVGLWLLQRQLRRFTLQVCVWYSAFLSYNCY